MFDLIAFDGDDTLWHSEILYIQTQARLQALLSVYQSPEVVAQRLFEVEEGNIELYGYGIKSFTLSMIETAIELSGGQITAREIEEIIGLAKGMLQAEVQLLDYAEEAVARLSTSHDLMLITKGDLLDQQTKIERSGLGGYFEYIEIVSRKTRDVYKAILERYRIVPERFLMVGNALRSDILPIVEIGGIAVYVPNEHTWAYEQVAEEVDQDGYYELEHLGLLPALVGQLSGRRRGSCHTP